MKDGDDSMGEEALISFLCFDFIELIPLAHSALSYSFKC